MAPLTAPIRGGGVDVHRIRLWQSPIGPGHCRWAASGPGHLLPPSQTGLNFKYKGESQAEFEERERRCLSTAIYFEARGEPLQGQIAVGQVIMNRVRSPQFPETICGVVYQGQMAPGCQFSFACDGKTDTPKNDSHWALAQKLARQITSGEVWLPEIGYSTFYHADYVSPYWKSTMNKIDSIGRHIFYKKRNEKAYIVEEASAAPAPKHLEGEYWCVLACLYQSWRHPDQRHSSAKSRRGAE